MEKSFEEQMAELTAAAEAAASRREFLRRKQGERAKKEVIKEDISPEEYSRRLKQSLKKDSSIVKVVSQDRINKSLKEWKEKVGPTFAEAHTQHQEVLQRASWLGTEQQSKTSILMAGNIGTGKAQPVSEPVALPNGKFKKMGSVKPGDFLLSEQGRPVEVLEVHKQGLRNVYLIAFDDGSKTYADEEHLWLVRKLGTGSSEWGTVETKFLAELPAEELRFYEIPMSAPVMFDEVELPLQPYLFASLITDRGTVKGAVPFEKPSGGRDRTYSELDRLGLIGVPYDDLRVPSIYYRGSIEQRVGFLQGVFDSAGHERPTGEYAVMTRNKSLKKALLNIVQSLGGTMKVKERKGLYTLIPSLPRTVKLFSESSQHYEKYSSADRLSPTRRFLKVRLSGKEETQCVSVDSPTHLYLTRNFIVTHNTWTAYAYLNKALQEGKVTAGQILTGSEMTLLGHITRAGFKAEDKWEEILNPKNRIYFIDDVGKASYSNSEARTAAWYSVIDHIYAHQLTIILTTNLNPTGQGPNSLYSWLGPAAYDRLMALVGKNFVPSNVNKRDMVWNGQNSGRPGQIDPRDAPPLQQRSRYGNGEQPF